ncbi:MAG: leucyl aminopeptidase [Deltaproteobacteria bacterium]|nr:leucyl aminopeptidase [Deltaproteobacteria bacterium]
MQIKVSVGAARDAKVDVLAVPVFKIDGKKKQLPSSLAVLDKAVGGALSLVVEQGDFRGKKGETQIVYPAKPGNAKRILLLGLGDPQKLDTEGLRELGGRCLRGARSKEAKKVALLAPSAKSVSVSDTCQALAEGVVLGGYRFDSYLTKDGKKKTRKPDPSLTLLYARLAKPAQARAGVKRGVTLAESQNLARDLSNAPGNAMPPVALAKAAVTMAREVGLRARVMDVPELKRRKMGGILAVGQGSSNPPRLVIIDHNPRPTGRSASKAKAKSKTAAKTRQPTICLIGKGVTFDSGGISIKPSANMHEMKHDMSGAATIVGAMRAIKLLGIPHRVIGIIAAAENLPSSTAYRPGDIIKMHSGKTVEILNTDAEGRLVLADALAYANETYSPVAMIDLATLTGACMIALGGWATGLMGTHHGLIEQVHKAGERTGECAWPLPLFEEHKKKMHGTVSDLINAGAGREAGMSTAAGFLSAFVGDTPWVHLDIAGTGWNSKIGAYQGRGATGVGVRLLLDFLTHWKPVS